MTRTTKSTTGLIIGAFVLCMLYMTTVTYAQSPTLEERSTEHMEELAKWRERANSEDAKDHASEIDQDGVRLGGVTRQLADECRSNGDSESGSCLDILDEEDSMISADEPYRLDPYKNYDTGIVCGNGTAGIPGCGNDSVSFDAVRKDLLPNFSLFQLAFTGIIAVVVITMAGVFLVASLGDPAKKKKAMGMVYNAIIAVVLAMLAYIIVQLVLGLNFQLVTSIPSALAQDAQNLIPPVPYDKDRPVNLPVGNENQNLGYFVQSGLNVLFYIVGPLVVIAFFIIGIKLVMSEGKDDDFKKSMKAMGYAALGLSLIGLAYAAIRTILSIRF